MKSSKLLITVILIAVLGLGWLSLITGVAGTQSGYSTSIKNAETSLSEGLYEQAVEYYKEALTYKNNVATYLKIKDAYDALYKEEHTPFIRGLYIDDMMLAANAFPKETIFWTTQINLYKDASNYDMAFDVTKQAMNRGAEGDDLSALYKELLYMVKLDFKKYPEYKSALNGYTSVFDGATWTVIDDSGERIVSEYNFIGLINDDGKGLYVNNIDARLLDAKEITRTRFNFAVEDAGLYNEGCDLLPVKVEGKWKYVNSAGEFLPGEFEKAGSFYAGEAVAYAAGKWVKLDEKGQQTVLRFEDIKLDQYGCHIQYDLVIAKENGKYGLYDKEFNKVSDFTADEMDICPDGTMIAFARAGKWGFIDTKGKEVIEPQYAGAKSFSNGYAAVCNEEGLWGFINNANEVVIDYAYLDAFYFTVGESCMVSTQEGTVQQLKFMFE